MNRSFLLPPLTAKELLAIQKVLRSECTPAAVYRRHNLLWQLAAGFNIATASQIAGFHYTNAHKWVKRFQKSGLHGLYTLPRDGRPRVYQSNQENLIIKIATSRPQDLGLGFTTWSLIKLEHHLRKQSGLKSLSRETIRRILGRHGLRFLTGQTWCESDDPDFEVKKTP